MKSQQIYLLVLIAVISSSAHAYVDPGSSLLLLQGVFAVLGAALVFVRHPVATIKALYRRIANKKVD